MPEGDPGTILVEKNKIYVTTADGQLRIDTLQLAGKKRMDAAAFLNGRALEGGKLVRS
jgi:methionyl-tRNA formyltransferase